MPILRVDQFGRIYQSDPNREDGLGYGGHAYPVTQGDLTLGSAYIKASRDYNNQVTKDARNRRRDDAKQKSQDQRASAARELAQDQQEKARELQDCELYRRKMANEAVTLGCECKTLPSVMSGDGMTANGQTGFNGMSRDQQTIHNHYLGVGYDSSLRVSNNEIAQKKADFNGANSEALRLQARQNLELALSRKNR